MTHRRTFLKLIAAAPLALLPIAGEQLDFENCIKLPKRRLLEFEEWYEQEEDELHIAWAETGCDRELDADWDVWVEHRYECYRAKVEDDYVPTNFGAV